MTELMGWMGLYATDGRINADLPAELSGAEIGRVRLVEFESDGYMARLELRRDPLGNKGNTKDSGIHRYDFLNKARRGHPHPFGMTPALFVYDEDNGILIWEIQKPDHRNPFDEPDEIEASDNEDGFEATVTLEPLEQPVQIETAERENELEDSDLPDPVEPLDEADPDDDEPNEEDWQRRFYKPIPEGFTL